ncbi:hypothetical protein CDD81_3248 [Ophiocordyceps australis]|uniref:Uncharacterized protein n=1 Tax=Ophiocordyceps australis TaxID=1399860 RepID=A0A2C5Y8S7_9HYPO|nr:hypothetical protein CDD81_3248 [Ophiocordyceps australis]
MPLENCIEEVQGYQMAHSVWKRSVQSDSSDEEKTMPISKRQRQLDEEIEQEAVMEKICDAASEQAASVDGASRDASPDDVSSSSSASSLRMSNRDAQGKLKSALRSTDVKMCAQDAANHKSVKSVRFDEQLNLEYSIAVDKEEEEGEADEEQESCKSKRGGSGLGNGESEGSGKGEEEDGESKRRGKGEKGGEMKRCGEDEEEDEEEDDSKRRGEERQECSSLIQLQPVAYQAPLTQSQLVAYQAMRGTSSPSEQRSSQRQPETGRDSKKSDRDKSSSAPLGPCWSERYDVSDDEGEPEQWHIEPRVFCLWATGVADGRRDSFADAMKTAQQEAGEEEDAQVGEQQDAVAKVAPTGPSDSSSGSSTKSALSPPEQKSLLAIISPDLPAALNDLLAPASIGGISRSALLSELASRHERLERAQSSLDVARQTQGAIAAQLDARRARLTLADHTVRAIHSHQQRSDAWARRCADAYAHAEALLTSLATEAEEAERLAVVSAAGLAAGTDPDSVPQQLLRLAERLGVQNEDLWLDADALDSIVLGHDGPHHGLVEEDDLENNSMF